MDECAYCSFVCDNAWNIAEVGVGVTGFVLAGMAVGRYVSLLARLMPIRPTCSEDGTASTTTGSLPAIRLRLR